MLRTALTELFTGRGKSLAYVGTALALTGAGTAAIASASPASSASSAAGIAGAARSLSVSDAAGNQHGLMIQSPAAGQGAVHEAADRAGPHHAASRRAAGGHSRHGASQHGASQHGASQHAAGRHGGERHGAHRAAGRHGGRRSRVQVVRHDHHLSTWKQVRDALARQTYPRPAAHKLPLADRLLPCAASGPQAYIPVTASRMANASTIVRQALSKHMGLRAAVIAVATAMQESTLENIDYGDRDSLGLFQQRPSTGWGTPAEVTDPRYAADAFLDALRGHQQADPGWASQPLWENAQAVQESGFPYAYAKWEAQAAQLVSHIARRMA